MLQSLIASLGFDPWLWCKSAQYNSGRCGGEVVLSPWSRLTPVSLAQSKLRFLQAASAVKLFRVTYSSRIPWCMQPSLALPLPSAFPPPVPPRQGDWRKKCWEECQKAVCSLPCLKIGILLLVFIFYTVFVLNEQPFCKLHCSLAWEQGEYLPSRDFCGKIYCCCT